MSVLPYLISLAISTGVGLYAWRRRAVPGAAPFALVALSQASMTLGYVFELISPGLEAKIFWDDTQWLGALAGPMALLAFALGYTGRKLSHPRRTWGLLAIVPIIFLLLVVTDDLHGLIRPVAWLVPGEPFSALVYDFTLAVWVAVLFGHGVALSSLLILAVHFARSPRLYRAQVGVILAGILIPLVGTILTLVGITLTFHRDTTPLTFALGNLVIAWGLFRYRLFDIVPTARDAVIESMSDAVIVLDARNRVVDLNPAAQEIIGHTASQVIGQPAAWVFSGWPDLVEQYQGAIEAQAEIVVGENEGQRHVDLRLLPLRNRHGRLTGRLVVLRDIAERVEKNAQLARANEQLTRQIAERVQAEEVLRLSHRFLEIANQHTEMPSLLGECVAQVRAFTECAAVGIRLLDDQVNIPYHAYEGFSQGFYESESPLSVGADQCMCINVVKGEADSRLPFYTEGGSFYMNGTTRFLATVSEEEKGKPRNVCNQAGYESVALVPIRQGERILGLIHVADPRENVVPLEMVKALEGASKELGTAIQRVRAEAALQRAHDELEERVEERTAELVRANASLKAEIAERVQAEAELIQEKTISDDILSSLPGIFYMYDEGRSLVRWNKMHEEALGYSAQELAHHHVLDFFEGEDKALIKSRVDQIFATGKADAEASIVTKNGERIPYYFTGVLTTLGGKRYFVGLGVDISERVRAEEALIQEKKISDDIISSLPGIFYMYDEGRSLVRWNKMHEEALGYSAQELAHMHVLDFFEGENKALIKSRVDQIFATGEADAEASIVTKNGERIPYYFTGLLTTLGGKRYFVGLGVDITERVRAEEALRRYAERLQILYEIDQGILAARSPETIAQAAVTRIRQLIPCQRAGVALFDFAAHEAVLLAIDLDAGTRVRPGTRLPLQPFEDTIAAGRQGRVTVMTGLQSRGRMTETLYAEGIRSLVSVPLLSQGALIGSFHLGLRASDPSAFTREYEDIARQVADQLAIAIQQARLYEQVQRHAEELEGRVADRTQELAVLYAVAAFASQSLELETTLTQSLKWVLIAMDSDAGVIHLLDEAGETLRLVTQQGLPPDLVAEMESRPANKGLGGWVMEHDEALIVPDVTSDPRMITTLPMEPRAYIGLPLRAGGRTLGVLGILRRTDQPPLSVEELSLLSSVADQLGVVVESARLRKGAEQAAVLEERGRLARELHDSVTQLLYSISLFAKAGRDAYKQGNVKQGSGHLGKLGDTASQAIKEMRLLLYELHPRELEREGLMGAIQHRLDAVEGRAGVKTQLVVDTTVELPKEVERELYHILQEALNNALKHAKATSVQVRLQADREGIRLDVTDDGPGFDPHDTPDEGGMGLANMRERAKKLGGTLTVLSEPGEGTTVQFNLENRQSPS